MKKKIFLALALVAMIACLFALTASAVEINGVNYTLDSDGTATVNKENRTATNLIAEIPSEIEHDGKTYKVDTIEVDAFYGNTTVTEIRILSEYITKIPSNMIANTYSTGALKKIYIDFSNITSIGSAGLNPSNQTNGNSPVANSFYYYDAKAFLKDGSDVVVTCPDFSNCTYIGAAAFQGANFEKVVIPEAVYMNNQMFRMSTMKELVIQGENREKLEYYAFAKCEQLKKIVIESKNLKEIGNDLFATSINVEEIYIDLSKCERVKSCAFMFSNKYDGGGTKAAWYDLEGNRIVNLSSMKYFEDKCFASSNLGAGTHETPTEIVWPVAIESIGVEVFRHCNMRGTLYMNMAEGKTATARFYTFDGNKFDLAIYGNGFTKIENKFEAQCTVVILEDNVTFGNDARFTQEGSVMYCKSSVNTSSFMSRGAGGTLHTITSGTVAHYGTCGIVASLVTADGNVTVGETTHNYTLTEYDNTYCPMNTMGNYMCSKCKDEKQVANEGTNPIKDGHAYDTVKSVAYKDGFLSEGVKTTVCRCALEKTENLKAIFVFNGYSTKENGTAICVGYTINTNELKAYNSVNDDLVFGVVASTKTENVLTAEGGTVIGGANTVVAPISADYKSFDFILSGFGEGQDVLSLVMCAYAFDGESISYLTSASNSVPSTITLKEVIEGES